MMNASAADWNRICTFAVVNGIAIGGTVALSSLLKDIVTYSNPIQFIYYLGWIFVVVLWGCNLVLFEKHQRAIDDKSTCKNRLVQRILFYLYVVAFNVYTVCIAIYHY